MREYHEKVEFIHFNPVKAGFGELVAMVSAFLTVGSL